MLQQLAGQNAESALPPPLPLTNKYDSIEDSITICLVQMRCHPHEILFGRRRRSHQAKKVDVLGGIQMILIDYLIMLNIIMHIVLLLQMIASPSSNNPPHMPLQNERLRFI